MVFVLSIVIGVEGLVMEGIVGRWEGCGEGLLSL